MTEDDDQPWERPGEFRRDLPSPAGPTLYVLSAGGLALAILFLWLPVVGLVINWVLWVVVRRQLAAMQAGRLSPDGMKRMRAARENALAGWLLSLSMIVYLAGFFAWVALRVR